MKLKFEALLWKEIKRRISQRKRNAAKQINFVSCLILYLKFLTFFRSLWRLIYCSRLISNIHLSSSPLLSTLSYPMMFCPTWSDPILSYPSLPWPFLPLSNPIPSLFLSYPIPIPFLSLSFTYLSHISPLIQPTFLTNPISRPLLPSLLSFPSLRNYPTPIISLPYSTSSPLLSLPFPNLLFLFYIYSLTSLPRTSLCPHFPSLHHPPNFPYTAIFPPMFPPLTFSRHRLP